MIKKIGQYDEAKAVDYIIVNKKIHKIQKIIQPYENKDIFNIYKFALFQNMIPDVILATQQVLKLQNNKTCIIINCIYNNTGSHKLDLLFIGKATMSWYFSYGIIIIKNLSIIWKHNKKAYITRNFFENDFF